MKKLLIEYLENKKELFYIHDKLIDYYENQWKTNKNINKIINKINQLYILYTNWIINIKTTNKKLNKIIDLIKN